MRIPDVELSELRYFHAVARAGSFAEGARRSHVSPPAVSKAIKKLENALHARLFDRSSRRVALTPAGRSLLEHASSVLAALERLGDSVGTDAALEGPLEIGATEVFSAHALPRALARLSGEHPGLVPSSYAMSPEEMLARLVEGTLDVALMPRPSSVPNGLHVEALAMSQCSVVCSPRHPLATRPHVDADVLAEQSFVGVRFFGRGPAVSPYGRVGATVDRVPVAVQLVTEGLFLGVFPDAMIRCQLNHGELRALPIASQPEPIELVAVWRYEGPRMQVVSAALRDALAQSLERPCLEAIQ